MPEGGGVGGGGEIHHLVRRRLFRRSGVTSVVSAVSGRFLFGVSTILNQYSRRYPDFLNLVVSYFYFIVGGFESTDSRRVSKLL